MELRKYLPLFKLRICVLITFSAIVGSIAAQSGDISVYKMAFLILATMMAATGASAYNHYFDMDIDRVMKRTTARPIPFGDINPSVVLFLASLLVLLSIILSFFALNFLVAVHLFLGAFVYVVVYTVWLKRRSWANIIIGGLAGSFAVLAGGASATPELCLPPVLLAIVMFFWTPSHFWSFAIFHKEDYKRAGVPMLPIVIGDKKTAIYIFINTMMLFLSSLTPYIFGYLGVVYIISAIVAGVFFIYRNIQLLKNTTKELAWINFKASMIYLFVILAAVIMDISIRR
ncbi:MAG: heme o synthase [Nitrospirota bacterium]